MKYNSKIITIPNIMSLFRICLIPIIIWFYCFKDNYQLVGALLILSGVTDIIDGFIARRFNMITDFGKALDPFADKLTQASMMFCLTLRFPLMMIPFILLVIKEIISSVLVFIIIKKTKFVPMANWHGKVATALLYSMMFIHVFWSNIDSKISFASIMICTIMIAISFLLYGIAHIKVLKDHLKKDN